MSGCKRKWDGNTKGASGSYGVASVGKSLFWIWLWREVCKLEVAVYRSHPMGMSRAIGTDRRSDGCRYGVETEIHGPSSWWFWTALILLLWAFLVRVQASFVLPVFQNPKLSTVSIVFSVTNSICLAQYYSELRNINPFFSLMSLLLIYPETLGWGRRFLV